MTKSFKEALKARRTFYRIQNKSTLSDKEIFNLFCCRICPLSFQFSNHSCCVINR